MSNRLPSTILWLATGIFAGTGGIAIAQTHDAGFTNSRLGFETMMIHKTAAPSTKGDGH